MIIKCITLKLNFNSVNESMPLFSQWLLWNCKLRLCECSWRLMDNLSTWSYKDWKATFRSHTMFHHPEGWPRAKTCIRWNNQDFPSRHFYCWIIKPCARGEAVSELGKTLNWIDLKATIELQLFLTCPWVIILTTMQKLSNMKTSQSQHENGNACVLWVSLVIRGRDLNLHLMVDQYGQQHSQHKPWTNWKKYHTIYKSWQNYKPL